MPRLPRLSGREAAKVFESLGWRVARRSSGHIILVREGSLVSLSVPDHKEVAQGTLRSLIRNARLTGEEFSAAWRRL